MNDEQLRKNINEKLSKMGYEHPSVADNSRNPQYMGYNTDYFSQSYEPYSKVNETIQTETSVTVDRCPMCEGKALYACDCDFRDMMCDSGHIWYVLKNGTIGLGDPHEEN